MNVHIIRFVSIVALSMISSIALAASAIGMFFAVSTASAAELVSVNSAGTDSGNGASGTFGINSTMAISADGRVVAFGSEASNLGSTDTNDRSDIYVRDLVAGTTTLVSVNGIGTNGGNGNSTFPVISADGQYVAFESSASNLGPTDTNGHPDIYVRDLVAGTTTLVSVNSDGSDSGNGSSSSPVISADGRLVAFGSTAFDFGDTDPNYNQDIYVRDLVEGTTTLVSVNGTGSNSGNGSSSSPVISADNRLVVFKSAASDLGPTDTNDSLDIYVRDLVAGTTTLVSVNGAGTDSGNSGSISPVISADGQVVVFVSEASNLSSTDTNGSSDIYVRDLVAGTTTLVSVNGAGTDSGNSGSFSPVISANGQLVAFFSSASNLGPTDTNGSSDIYVRDLVAGTTTLVSVNGDGSDSGNSGSSFPVISADGRLVAFESYASDLWPTDTNNSPDIYVRDLVAGTTTLVSVNGPGSNSGNGSSTFPVINANGQSVAFISYASDLGPTDNNGASDVYVSQVLESTTYVIVDGDDGGDCGLIGNWVTVGDEANPVSQTCTLTGNVPIGNNIQICNSGAAGQVILDGNGFSMTGLGAGTGVAIEECGDVTVKNLTIQNFESGIVVDIGSAFISILDNTISDSEFGISVLNSGSFSDHLITDNTISNNAVGINLDASSHDNQIYNNNFVDNIIQAQDEGTNNLFNLSAPTGGNYWSNYDSPAEGCDNPTPADEFCDVPYAFTSNHDILPWIVSNGWFDSDGDGISDAIDEDDDNDGIFDKVDTLPTTPSDDFSDGTSFGSIVDRGDQTLKITDAEDPGDGVLLEALFPGGPLEATAEPCGYPFTLDFNEGDSFNLTCGSVTVEVISGTVNITFFADDGTVATSGLTEGNALTVDPETATFTADADNAGIVVILFDGVEFLLSPGESINAPTGFAMELTVEKAKAKLDLKKSNKDKVKVEGEFRLDPGSDDIVIGTNSDGLRVIDEAVTVRFDGRPEFEQMIPAGSLVETDHPNHFEHKVKDPSGPVEKLEIEYVEDEFHGKFEVKWKKQDLQSPPSPTVEDDIIASDPVSTTPVPVPFDLDIGNDNGKEVGISFELDKDKKHKRVYKFKNENEDEEE